MPPSSQPPPVAVRQAAGTRAGQSNRISRRRSDLEDELYSDRTLARVRCMRGTVFIVSRALLPTVTAASRRIVEPPSTRYLARVGVTKEMYGMPEWMERMWRGEALEPFRAVFDAEHLRVDEIVEDDTLVVRAELSGVDPDKDVEITVAGGMLTIRAERRQEKEVEEDDVRRSEIRYGLFSRRLPLPEGVKPNEIAASYKDGILTVRVPMEPKAAETAKIPVKRG